MIDPPRALVVCPTFPLPEFSGGRKRAVRLLQAMEAGGARPHLLSLGQATPDGLADAARRGWAVECFVPGEVPLAASPRPLPGRRPAVPSRALLMRLDELLDDERTAFVQFEEHHAAPYVRFVGGRRPSSYSAHNVDSDVLRQLAGGRHGLDGVRLRRRAARLAKLESRAASAVDVVLAVSQADCAYFVEHARAVLEVPNGVDESLFSIPLPTDGEDVLFFGQLEYAPNREGLLRFLEAGWPEVRRSLPYARLRVAGNGVESLGLDGSVARAAGVDLLGYVEDLSAELVRASVVVAPLWAGGGTRIKVLESLAASRPVVGTELAVEELGFRSGRHGLVADRAEGLGKAIIELLRQPDRLSEMASAGRELANGYRWENVLGPAQERYRAWVDRHA